MGFRPSVVILIAAGFCACVVPQERNKVKIADDPFISGGSVQMHLEGGSYSIRPAADDHVRIAFEGNTGNANAEITTSGTHADLVVKNTPRSNFQANIEVPKAADLVIHLSAGNLDIAAIIGNKDIDSNAGNVSIAAGDPGDYASVDASVKVGDIDAGVFGGSKSGLLPHFTWTGHGKYTLRAVLGAGNLELRGK